MLNPNDICVKLNNILLEKDLTKCEDGIYSWIVYKPGLVEDPRIAYIKVEDTFEYQSTHGRLACNVRASSVYLAGEFEKSTNPNGAVTIKFNLLSGTFMRDYLKKFPVPGYEIQLVESLISFLDLKNVELIFDMSGQTMITAAKTQLTMEKLRNYVKKGLIVYIVSNVEDIPPDKLDEYCNYFYNYAESDLKGVKIEPKEGIKIEPKEGIKIERLRFGSPRRRNSLARVRGLVRKRSGHTRRRQGLPKRLRAGRSRRR